MRKILRHWKPILFGTAVTSAAVTRQVMAETVPIEAVVETPLLFEPQATSGVIWNATANVVAGGLSGIAQSIAS